MIPLYSKVATALFLTGLIIKLAVISLDIDWFMFQVGLTFTTIALGVIVGGYLSDRNKIRK